MIVKKDGYLFEPRYICLPTKLTNSNSFPEGHRCIDEIMDFCIPERLRQREMVVRYTSKAGVRRFHGGQHLKGSQSYPAGSLDCAYRHHTYVNGVLNLKGVVFFQFCHPRFGRALSKVRSKHQKRNYRLATEFLRKARKSDNEFDCRPHVNRMWSKHCGIDQMIKFLSSTKR